MLVKERRANGPFRDLVDLCRRCDQRMSRRVLEALIRAGSLDALGANRATLMHTLPRAMQLADQSIKARVVGQDDMFGLFEAPTAPTQHKEEVQTDWSSRVRLEGERDTLGLYLTGHPFAEFEHEVRPVISGRIADLKSDPPPVSEEGGFRFKGKPVTVGGMVFDLGKRGSRIVFTLDDRSGRLEASCFDDVYQQYRSILVKDAIVVVEGSIRWDDFIEGWRLTTKKISTIDQIREGRAQRLYIRWPAHADGKFVQVLEQVLRPYKGGGCAVTVQYSGASARADLQLSEEWRVKPSLELTERLAQLSGQDGVRIVYSVT
jgi:DNA polymerase III subunit alpha